MQLEGLANGFKTLSGLDLGFRGRLTIRHAREEKTMVGAPLRAPSTAHAA